MCSNAGHRVTTLSQQQRISDKLTTLTGIRPTASRIRRGSQPASQRVVEPLATQPWLLASPKLALHFLILARVSPATATALHPSALVS